MITKTDDATPAAAPEVPWERVDQFVGQLTHDVRNGLNALELQLTFLGEICADPEAAEEVKGIRKTLGDVTRQLQTVRIATGAPLLHRLTYPAGEFFEDLRERFERQEAAGKSRVRWQIEVGTAALSVDPEAAMTAFLELLGNALHFGGGQTAIILSASAQASMIVATLRETPAAPPASPPEGWGHNPLLSTRRGAYGLGLFRARRIIEMQEGTYRAEYSASDQALTTRVTLPLASVP